MSAQTIPEETRALVFQTLGITPEVWIPRPDSPQTPENIAKARNVYRWFWAYGWKWGGSGSRATWERDDPQFVRDMTFYQNRLIAWLGERRINEWRHAFRAVGQHMMREYPAFLAVLEPPRLRLRRKVA